MTTISRLPRDLWPLFWDCDPEQLELVRHATFIIERLMVYTTPAAYQWLLDTYPRQRLQEVVAGSRRLGGRDRNFWRLILAAS